MRVLYLSYNGLLDPLGQSQVLHYLVRLSGRGHSITLITYEKHDEWLNVDHRVATQRLTTEAGIRWIPLSYRRRPRGLAPAFGIALGLIVAVYIGLRHRVQIVHVRGYVLGFIGLATKWIAGARFIFDTRSSWVDERVELGIWSEGSILHRLGRWFEKECFKNADASVVLTRIGAETVRNYPYMRTTRAPVAVITTCTNLDLFKPTNKESHRGGDLFTLGYLGTVGRPYMLEGVFNLLRLARASTSDVKLLIINRRDGDYIRDQRERSGVPPEAIEVKNLTHGAVARELWGVTAGVFFYEPTYCQRFRAPTKLGEFLACGVPCIVNAGIGDVTELLESERVGIVVPDCSEHSLAVGLSRLLELCAEPDIRERCAAAARRHFSLADGVRAYDSLYRAVVSKP